MEGRNQAYSNGLWRNEEYSADYFTKQDNWCKHRDKKKYPFDRCESFAPKGRQECNKCRGALQAERKTIKMQELEDVLATTRETLAKMTLSRDETLEKLQKEQSMNRQKLEVQALLDISRQEKYNTLALSNNILTETLLKQSQALETLQAEHIAVQKEYKDLLEKYLLLEPRTNSRRTSLVATDTPVRSPLGEKILPRSSAVSEHSSSFSEPLSVEQLVLSPKAVICGKCGKKKKSPLKKGGRRLKDPCMC